MKTGRMAPVKGQLTDGALTPNDGVCVHGNLHADTSPLHSPPTAQRSHEV